MAKPLCTACGSSAVERWGKTGSTIVAQQCPASFSDARDVLRKVRTSIGRIDESIRLDEGRTLPATGWYELLDELALQARLGKT